MSAWLNTGLNGDYPGYAMYLDHYVDPGLLDPLKAIYRVASDVVQPVMFRDDSGRLHKFDLVETDMGSIPGLIQSCIPKDRFLLAFIFHDDAYHTHTMTVSDDNGKTWQRIPITFDQANQRLRDGILCYPQTPEHGEAEEIYLAVQEFGQSDWDTFGAGGD